jgi:triacylglycerol lipase
MSPRMGGRQISRMGSVLGIAAAAASLSGCPLAWAAPGGEVAAGGQAVDSDTVNPLTGGNLGTELTQLIDGVSPTPSTPGDFVGFTGEPSLLDRIAVAALDVAAPFEKILGIDFESTIAPLIASDSPPEWLTALDGITVTETEYDGMPVYDLTPADPSGQYVVAIHGGAYVDQPTLLHWLSYTDMAHETGATVVVPIYPLEEQGGTAGTVEPEIANLISAEIGAEGAGHVSVIGDSAGGGIALAAVELLAGEDKAVPDSMVLESPTLEAALDNPNITLVDDPILNLAELQTDGQVWAGGLPLTDPLVSPLYGSLEALPTTYVYSGSDDVLAPDVLTLEQDAIAQDAPFSFILRVGEIHDWALAPILDGAQVQSQIYQELGLTSASTAATAGHPDNADLWGNALQMVAADLSSGSLNWPDISTDITHVLTTVSADATASSGDLCTWVAGAIGAL